MPTHRIRVSQKASRFVDLNIPGLVIHETEATRRYDYPFQADIDDSAVPELLERAKEALKNQDNFAHLPPERRKGVDTRPECREAIRRLIATLSTL